MTTGERRRRLAELIAQVAAEEGLDAADRAAVYTRLAERADEDGDGEDATELRTFAEHERAEA